MKIYLAAKAIFDIFRNFMEGCLPIAGIDRPYDVAVHPLSAQPLHVLRLISLAQLRRRHTAQHNCGRRFCILPEIKKSYFL
jgi:hypothetical protein